MKADLDRLMAERGFAALLVIGEVEGNHALRYLTNGARITHGTVLKVAGQPPLIVANAMERDEAAKSGLQVVTTTEFGYHDIIRRTGNLLEADAELLAAILTRYGVSGTVSVYGVSDPGRAYLLLGRLDELLPEVTITGEGDTTVFDEAYATKDEAELAAMRSVAERTNAVMGEVVDFIRSHRVVDGQLVEEDGCPLTVAGVKAYLQERLMAAGLEDNGETIFAVGRDGGVPHSRGEDTDILTVGACIVFDLFPRDRVTGYYHDMTRTYCLGQASPEVEQAYEQVMQAFDAVSDALAVGEQGSRYQDIACDVFEEHGHPTPSTHPGTEVGYVHNLGHGVGLQIHARPRLSAFSADMLEAGQVFTVEPGLYYPDDGYGVRIEDTMMIDELGNVHSLTPTPKRLVIPLG
jgi:Xaa-Pro aminopeptidase